MISETTICFILGCIAGFLTGVIITALLAKRANKGQS